MDGGRMEHGGNDAFGGVTLSWQGRTGQARPERDGEDTVGCHVVSPEGEVVAQKLQDERRVLVAFFVQRVQLGNRILERRLRQLARPV